MPFGELCSPGPPWWRLWGSAFCSVSLRFSGGRLGVRGRWMDRWGGVSEASACLEQLPASLGVLAMVIPDPGRLS